MMTTRVAVAGATGSMGQLVCQLVDDSNDFELVARLDSTSDFAEMLAADVIVDVSVPDASPIIVRYAVEHKRNVLVGTSGWGRGRIEELEALIPVNELAVIIIPNFSIGSIVASSLAAAASRFFDSIEIVEAHHEGKVDSPSGTAVRTAEVMAQARAGMKPALNPHSEQDARGHSVDGIPIHSLRMMGILAHQEVRFGGIGENLTVSHETVSQKAYERGIMLGLRAARDSRGLIVGLDKLLNIQLPQGLETT
jgi:4-hydroxy-tetrahydrodipicolinate reductase